MTKSVLRLAAYRFATTFSRRWGGYLTLILLIGLIGGVGMGAVAGARRTQSSFPTYLASTNPSDVETFTEFAPISNIGYSEQVNQAIARLPHVTHAADTVGFDGNLQILQTGPGNLKAGEAPTAIEGSTNGEYLTQDRVTLVSGRLTNPASENEVVASAGAAAQSDLRIGSTVPVAFFTNAQVNSPTFAGYPTDQPYLLIKLKLVGIVKSSSQIIQDDDAALQDQFAVITPTLTRRLATCCAYYSYVGLQIKDPARNEATVLAAVKNIAPNLGPISGRQTSGPTVAKAERAIRPESIAFGVFGLIALLAALLICGQVIGRLLRRNADDGVALRALGAGPVMTTADGLVGVLGAVVVGSLVAVAVAIALSPLAPIGAVRSVYPGGGIAFDWTVLGFGLLLLVGALGSASFLMAYLLAPHRASNVEDRAERGSAFSRSLASLGLPPTALGGIRSALGLGTGRDAAPVRSALLGAVLAVVVVVASITFGASLNSLVSRPALYGWNWNYMLLSGFSGQEDLPAGETAALLNHDHAVGRWAGVYLQEVQLDGQGIPALVSNPNASVGPPVLSGHGLESDKQVVLGSATLAALHKQVGDTVVARTGRGSPATRLRIVGTATLPSIKGTGAFLQMGTGAVVSPSLYSALNLNEQQSAIPGPNAVLIAMRPGVSSSAGLRSLDRITRVLNESSDPDGPIGGVVSVLRPAEIANYRTISSIPAVLSGVLAAGAIGALGLTLIASVRRRRREFALLKTLGFTQRQVASTVAWQSSVSGVVGLVLGVPLGVALGRWLWTLFARGISAVPDPTVSAVSLVLIVLGALVFANLAAAIPGQIAARAPAAALFRAE